MSFTNCGKYNANSFLRSPYNNTLSPAAREAKIIIPEGIVAKQVALYREKINQTQATDSAPKSIIGRVKQKNTTNPSPSPKTDPEDKIAQTTNQSSEKKYNEEVIDVTPIFTLPQEMLLNICTFLNLKPLNTLLKTSKDLHQLISTSPSYQDKVSSYYQDKASSYYRDYLDRIRSVEFSHNIVRERPATYGRQINSTRAIASAHKPEIKTST